MAYKRSHRSWNWRPLKLWWRWFANKIDESWQYVVAHWPRYLLSTVTATFTFHAAFTFTEQAYYGVMAVLLCEGMFLHWLSRLEVYENRRQLYIAFALFAFACFAVISTDISSAVLLANENETFTIYAVIPDNVQWLVTNITPILASFNLIAYGLYEFFSDSNSDKREEARQKRELHRTLRSSDRDMQKLRARGRVLARKRKTERLQIKHTKQYGGDLVKEANKDLKMSAKEEEEEGFLGRLADVYNEFFGRKR